MTYSWKFLKILNCPKQIMQNLVVEAQSNYNDLNMDWRNSEECCRIVLASIYLKNGICITLNIHTFLIKNKNQICNYYYCYWFKSYKNSWRANKNNKISESRWNITEIFFLSQHACQIFPIGILFHQSTYKKKILKCLYRYKTHPLSLSMVVYSFDVKMIISPLRKG